MAKTSRKTVRQLRLEAPAALEALRRMRIGVLSVLLKPGQPYSAVVNVHVDDKFRFYFASNEETRKLKALVKSPNVALNLGFDTEMVNNFQITGRATIINDASRWRDLFKVLADEKPKNQLIVGLREMTAHYPFRHFPRTDAAIVMIEPTWIRWFRHAPDAKAPGYVVILGDV